MRITKNVLLALVMTAGCATDDSSGTADGNSALGIAQFRIDDSAARTTVVGLDAQGVEVARMELAHGVFTPSELFKDGLGDAQVDGRVLDVFIRGSEQLRYETAGYGPVMHMPAHPAHLTGLIAFMADPHVTAILDRWQLGFESQGPAVGGEDAYVTATYSDTYGDSYQNCDNTTTCGSAYYGTINTCGGGAAAIQAGRLTHRNGNQCNFYVGYDEVVVTQYCPSGSGGQSNPWLAVKSCPTTSSNTTQCGTRTSGACVGCGAYPTYYGGVSVTSGATVGTCNGYTVQRVSSYYEDGANCTQAEIENCQLGYAGCSSNPDYCYNSPEIMAQLAWCSSYCGV